MMLKSIPFGTNGDDHLDPDTLAAFAEGALNEGELASLYAHAAECERCREGLHVHMRLRELSSNIATRNRLVSGGITMRSLGIAAGLACAVLGLALILLPGRNSRKPVATFQQQARAVPSSPSLPGQDLREAGNGSIKKASATVAGWRSSQRSHSPEAVWRTNRFRTLAFGPDFRFAPEQPTLPRPFASARLDLQTSFQTASLETPEREETTRASTNKRIAVRTALGERRIYLIIPSVESNEVQ